MTRKGGRQTSFVEDTLTGMSSATDYSSPRQTSQSVNNVTCAGFNITADNALRVPFTPPLVRLLRSRPSMQVRGAGSG